MLDQSYRSRRTRRTISFIRVRKKGQAGTLDHLLDLYTPPERAKIKVLAGSGFDGTECKMSEPLSTAQLLLRVQT